MIHYPYSKEKSTMILKPCCCCFQQSISVCRQSLVDLISTVSPYLGDKLGKLTMLGWHSAASFSGLALDLPKNHNLTLAPTKLFDIDHTQTLSLSSSILRNPATFHLSPPYPIGRSNQRQHHPINPA